MRRYLSSVTLVLAATHCVLSSPLPAGTGGDSEAARSVPLSTIPPSSMDKLRVPDKPNDDPNLGTTSTPPPGGTQFLDVAALSGIKGKNDATTHSAQHDNLPGITNTKTVMAISQIPGPKGAIPGRRDGSRRVEERKDASGRKVHLPEEEHRKRATVSPGVDKIKTPIYWHPINPGRKGNGTTSDGKRDGWSSPHTENSDNPLVSKNRVIPGSKVKGIKPFGNDGNDDLSNEVRRRDDEHFTPQNSAKGGSLAPPKNVVTLISVLGSGGEVRPLVNPSSETSGGGNVLAWPSWTKKKKKIPTRADDEKRSIGEPGLISQGGINFLLEMNRMEKGEKPVKDGKRALRNKEGRMARIRATPSEG
ncbi:hypothetical protein BDZ90DRAFT_228417 [Jaminaea rosea]|uniref:Pal1-domain-containing protein n=1 Tax=Jaminaea rosea TaxID=1569628 RepID=A0A316UN71_9BASI|nr:hypothetical protein BDZ90DRAFT_228417 [Jaminaea rosea]PWN25363.1 hypothetical protein BDZ90DRAFT_228417 [Jaminaea rosea]